MREIIKPYFEVDEIFNSCYSSLNEGDYKNRINLYKEQLIIDEYEYQELFVNDWIDKFVDGLIGDHLTLTEPQKKELISDMEYLYNKKLVGGNAECRKYYEALLNPEETDFTCPFCGIDSIQSLDHYLPKSKYPALAITPVNLVGMCSDCNRGKSNSEIKSISEHLLHPYFSNVIKNNPYSLDYHADKNYIEFKINSTVCTRDKGEQIRYHIKQLELIERMNKKKMAFLTNIKTSLEPLKKIPNSDIGMYRIYLKNYNCNSFIESAIVQELYDNDEFLEKVISSLE